LDKFISEQYPTFSRSCWQKLIKNGEISVDNKIITSKNFKLLPNTVVEFTMPSQNSEIPLPTPEDIPLNSIYEDKDILVINKPAGIIVHPGDGNPNGTIVNGLLQKYNESLNFGEIFEDKYRPGVVHRLDKETSGALIIAKNEETLLKLKAMFKNREINKTYIALIHGFPQKQFDTIKFSIDRHPVNRKKMAVSPDGKEAITHISLVQSAFIENQPVSILEVKIETGRTHQIRVHLSKIGIPIIGDKLYGGFRKKPEADRQMLHAWKIEFKHPMTGKTMRVTAPFPEDINMMIQKIHS
jgi:23S rRNA pseudouridine1911/1915/1917 synthase